MAEFLKESPFTVALTVVALGTTVWFGFRWWVVIIACVVGFIGGALLDKLADESD